MASRQCGVSQCCGASVMTRVLVANFLQSWKTRKFLLHVCLRGADLISQRAVSDEEGRRNAARPVILISV